jgi:predicted Rossmann fold nucleotide-binding protein DprA/Smf involved in DNA uptake
MNDLFSESIYDRCERDDDCRGDILQPVKADKEKPVLEKKFNNPIEQKILEELKNGNIEIDKFIRKNNFPVDEVNEAVTLLEISGYITRRGNIIYDV